MTRVGEKGSILGFIVGGVLLTALVLGGIWTIRQIGQPAEVAIEQSVDEESETEDSSKEAPADEGRENDQSEDQAKDIERDGGEDQSTTGSTDGDSEGSSDKSMAGSDEAADTESLVQAGQKLPQSGSRGIMTGGVALAALLGATLVYRRSLQL